MNVFINLLIFIGALIILCIDYLMAKAFQKIAEEKGYSNSKSYFWWTFWVFPAGAAMVIALPDRNARQSSSYNDRQTSYGTDSNKNELPDL